MNLTEKQKKFIDYYIATGNATESCRKAGYKGNNLDRIGYENLRKLENYIKPRVESLDNALSKICLLPESKSSVSNSSVGNFVESSLSG